MSHARGPGGHRLYYEILGDPAAPTLLMLRGLARSSRYWLEVIPLLEPHLRLVLMDNRGVGRSDTPVPPYSTRQMARDVVAVMDDAGLGRVSVLGISLGGMIAQWVAIDHPERVDRLVLGATTSGGKGAVPIPRQVALGLLRTAHLPFHEAMRRTASMTATPDFVKRRPDLIDRWCDFARREPPSRLGVVGQLMAAAGHDTSAQLSAIRARTLVVTGDADAMIPSANSHHLAGRIAGARLAVLAGAGHDFPTEMPDRTCALLLEFLGLETGAAAAPRVAAS
jgi:3-oxoadipate enol-lactonase